MEMNIRKNEKITERHGGVNKSHHGFRWYHDKDLVIRFIQQSSIYRTDISKVTADSVTS